MFYEVSLLPEATVSMPGRDARVKYQVSNIHTKNHYDLCTFLRTMRPGWPKELPCPSCVNPDLYTKKQENVSRDCKDLRHWPAVTKKTRVFWVFIHFDPAEDPVYANRTEGKPRSLVGFLGCCWPG